MTLKDMKIKTFSLIEEYYPEETGLAEDEDVLNKINGVVNQIQLDLMKYRKINATHTKNIDSETSKTILINSEINDLYQLNKIVLDPLVEYSMPDDNTLVLPDDYEGTLKVYYYKYPTLVELVPPVEESSSEETETTTEETTEEVEETEENTENITPVSTPSYDETFVFDLDDVLLEIMPYGIAADLLKMDMISNYGKYFYDRYLEMKNGIDSRKTSGMIFIEGGVDI
jgi:hypothetical protein